MTPRARHLVLPGMLLLFAGYVAAHLPVREALRRLGDGRPMDAITALAALLAATVGGWILSSCLPARRTERLVLFGLGTLALATVPAAILGALGWALDRTPLQPPLGPLSTALPALAVSVWGVRRGWRPRLSVTAPAVPLVVALLVLLAVVLLGFSASVGLSHPPDGYDALSYHGPLAVYLWRDGNLGLFLERQPWAWALAHPGTAELWFGLLRLAGGEGTANLGQLPLALLGGAAVYVFARRSGLGRGGASLGALGFISAPIVVVQSGMQLNDVSAAALLMAAVALAAAPTEEWSGARLAGIGAALGLAATTKLAMLPGVSAVWLYLVVAVARSGWPARGLLAAAAAFGVVVAPWWLRNLALYGNPIFPAALPLIGRGYVVGAFEKKDDWFVPAPEAWPLYPLVEPVNEMSGLGTLFAVGVVPGLLAAIVLARRGPVALFTLLAGVSLPAWWLLTQHEPRLLLAVLGCAFGFLGWALVAVPRRHRGLSAGLLGLAAIFSAALTVEEVLRPAAAQPTVRWEFYDRVWGIDSVAATLPEQEGMLYHTGHAKLSYAGDYPLLGPNLGRELIVVDDVLPQDSLVGVMRRAGLRYAYVPAAPAARETVETMYAAPRFHLVHASTVEDGDRRGTRRYLFRLEAE